jgi:creatinine amidohydrolase
VRRLADLRAPEIAERLGPASVVLQPIAAVEQHGAHLPLSTDLVIAEAVVDAVVAERGDELDLWVLPPLAYGKSNEHDWCPGTVTLGVETLLRVLDDVGRSVARLPTRRLAFVNGHGGNSSLLQVALRELRIAHGLQTFLLHPSVPPDQGGASTRLEQGMGIHGGQGETSLLLHLRPDLVDMGRAARHVPEGLAGHRHVRFGGPVAFGWTSDDFGPSGVIGDPTGASAERGKRQFERIVATMGEALAEVARFSLPAG